ncbi:unknown [Bacteroides sp. CAG:1060]|nr:unknown [Bacteroides sp. CAG:1060]
MPVQKTVKGIIPLPVKWRQKEYEKSQSYSAHSPFHIRVFEFPEFVLQPQRSVGKIQGKQAGSRSKPDIERDVRHREGCKVAGENRGLAPEDICYHRGRNGRNQQWKHGLHGNVEKQYFHCEEHTCQRGLEYPGHSTCSTASEQQGNVPVGKLAHPAYVGTYGRTGIYYRRLSSDGTTETYGKTGSQHRRPHIVGLDLGLVP